MALANFFDKVSLGLSQILKGYDRSELEKILSNRTIELLYDENAATTAEGKATLDLSVRLLARLYPKIRIETPYSSELKQALAALARSINPAIEITDVEEPFVCLAVGKTRSVKDSTTFYVGSSQWTVHFSDAGPVGSLDSNNPFGAGAAACIGAANVFRYVFKDYLPHSQGDTQFSLSLLDYSLSASPLDLPITDVHLSETILVGLGAVGNGVAWALRHLKDMSGKLIIIDHEKVALSNLQRYILTDQDSINVSKTEIVERQLQETNLIVSSKPVKGSEYISERNDWNIDTILICVDNAEDRIMIQGALPRKIFGAWTQTENLGVSRHLNFGEDPCLCCLYFPTLPRLSRSQEVANSLNLATEEKMIREFLANGKPIDMSLLKKICASNQLQLEEFSQYIGSSLEVFYSEVVCGGVIVKCGDAASQNLQVPCAFESAMAGILLAAELIKDNLGYRSPNSTTTQFNLIRSISRYLNVAESKKKSCICNDADFKNRFDEKWRNRN